MQIHKSKYTRKKNQSVWWIVAIALFALVIYASVTSKNKGAIHCDMESQSEDKKHFLGNGYKFTNGQTQSDHLAFSGKYSARLDKDQLYGPGYTFDHVYSGDVYEASIWMNNDNGFGTLGFSGTWGFYDGQKGTNKTENGWHQIKHRVTIPIGVYDEKLSIFPYTNKDSKAVYFDDLSVEKISAGNPAALPAVSNDPSKRLDIILDKSALDKLKEKRVDAYKHGSLISSKKDLVPAKIKSGDLSINAQVRLKGDLLDHLSGRQWSFRIHTDDGHAWKGMKVFSVHNSKSRDHLSEWVFHQMLTQEDVLTTQYDFVELALNGESLGIYAYEEHFLKQLLQSQGRSEGPILKISEDAHWQYAPRSFGKNLAYYESAQIEPFDKNAVKNSKGTAAAFEKGQALLYGFIHGELQVEDVFDVDRFAKYIAIQDVCNAWHSFNYTNLRFYFNPKVGRLEPIGYDGFTPDGLRYNKDLYITGSQVNALTTERITAHKFVKVFHKKIFTNLPFSEKYIAHLERMSSPAYLENFKQKNEEELRTREQFIRKAYVNYKFDWDAFFDNANEIHEVIVPAEELSLKAYRDGKALVLRSYHLLPLEVLGFGDKEMTVKSKSRTILESYDKTKPVLEQIIALPSGVKKIFVRTLGTDRTMSFPIFKWVAPTNNAANASRMIQVVDFPFITNSPEAYIIAPGKHVLNKSLVALDKQLIFQAGAEVDLQNGASIIAGHSIQALGNVDAPIVFRSSNTTGMGLVILDAKAASDFKSCTFDNLQATKQYSLHTTGGVNVYNSEVNFKRCVFSNAKSKDALHLDRCTYEMNDCVFIKSSGDGLDANFSTGILNNIVAQGIGKDAIEISGGFARAFNPKINNAAGAALHANQHATLEFTNMEITDCTEGIKSVDLSEVTLTKVNLKNVEIGLLAFRKNDEMGGGTIKALALTEAQVGKRNVHDSHSTILLDNNKLPSQ